MGIEGSNDVDKTTKKALEMLIDHNQTTLYRLAIESYRKLEVENLVSKSRESTHNSCRQFKVKLS